VNVWAWRGGEAGPASPAGLEVMYEDETFWLSQRRMAELFGVDDRTVSEHLGNIYASGELAEQATHRKFRRVRREGSREVSRAVAFYNLDAIISVGYRVNSRQATEFRIWATRTLREYPVKGFVAHFDTASMPEQHFALSGCSLACDAVHPTTRSPDSPATKERAPQDPSHHSTR